MEFLREAGKDGPAVDQDDPGGNTVIIGQAPGVSGDLNSGGAAPHHRQAEFLIASGSEDGFFEFYNILDRLDRPDPRGGLGDQAAGGNETSGIEEIRS